jgi:hypothetical protein
MSHDSRIVIEGTSFAALLSEKRVGGSGEAGSRQDWLHHARDRR